MIERITLILALLAFLLCIVQPGGAAMQSQHYRIPVHVISGGGSSLSSTNYKIHSTSGQSSPLMDTQDPSFSDNYDQYPGFWYTIGYWEVPKRAKTTPLILLLLNE
jgi:hypothetical protein